ncbi:tetratricopeptide repeat protein [Myxococcus qinghaiensis]|uniref:tetratricopeptide repeat protein n=1 Tax=Myxococcus qinghaiensis TaxID=2906758 RepID=UPI0020A7082D|nr:tetratricopeptide repeat protein [Myxococcus qinghaiensis]
MRSVDVIILTAIPLEYDAARKVEAGAVQGSQWEEERRPNGLRVSFRAYEGKAKRPLRVALALAGGMGAVEATTALLPLVEEYSPRCVAMCGVCAGHPKKTNLGDVIAPNRLFFHDTGKRHPTAVQQDLTTYNLRYDWEQDLKCFDFVARFKDETWWRARPVPYEWQENWALLKLHEEVAEPWKHPEYPRLCPQWRQVIETLRKSGDIQASGSKLTEQGRARVEDFLFQHAGLFPDLSPTGELFPFRVHTDPMGSGSQVIEDVNYWGSVSSYMRKALGLEMEAAAVGALAHSQPHRRLDALVMKSVMDFANAGRDDHFKEYAARVSAECLMAFLREHVDVEVVPGIDDLLTSGAVEPPQSDDLPSSLLNARHQVVAFHGREDVISGLDQWCSETTPVSIRLLHSEGGVGKTRLAIEWVRRRKEQWWVAGFLTKNVPADWLERLYSLGRPLLIVIDYAESRLGLETFLARLARYARQNGEAQLRHVRILLLARNDGDWWASLRNPNNEMGAWLSKAVTQHLIPLASTESQRTEEYHRAAEKFSALLGKTYSRAPPMLDFDDHHFERTLYIHMAALASVKSLEFRPKTLMDAILDHEEQCWEQHAERTRASLVRQRHLARQTVVAATLRGGFATRGEAVVIVERILRRRLHPEEDELLQQLQWLYQHTTNNNRPFLPALEPDLLGEAMVMRLASPSRETNERAPPEWVVLVISPDDPDATVRTALELLSRASAEHPTVSRSWLEQLLPGTLLSRRSVLALEAAKATGQQTAFSAVGDVLLGQLVAAGGINEARLLHEAGIPEQTVILAEVATWVEKIRLEALPIGVADSVSERAEILNNLGTRYLDVGRQKDALKALEEATSHYRSLAQINPNFFQPRLAASLNNQGAALYSLNQYDAALKLTHEAVDIYRQLATQDPDNFEPDLAMSLNTLGTILSHMHQTKSALKSIGEAVTIYLSLSTRHPGTFEPDLAGCLNNLGNALRDSGYPEKALDIMNKAVTINRHLAKKLPDAFQPDLARSLNNLGSLYREMGRSQEALKNINEAISIHRPLALHNPASFQHGLAMSLANLGNILSDLTHHEAARQAIGESISLYRNLSSRNPQSFQPELARQLHNLGIILKHIKNPIDALKTLQEATDILRTLAIHNHALFMPNIAENLYLQGKILREERREEEALSAFSAAVECIWPLFFRDPSSYEQKTGVLLACVESLHQGFQRPLPSEFQERIDTFLRLIKKDA